jgi:hypothetical protein
LVRPVAEGPDTADCVCAPRIAETEIVAVSITRTSRTGFFQSIRNIWERCGCGSNTTCFPFDFNLVSRPRALSGYSPSQSSESNRRTRARLYFGERISRQETSIVISLSLGESELFGRISGTSAHSPCDPPQTNQIRFPGSPGKARIRRFVIC